MTKLVYSTILSGERKRQESKQEALEPVSQFSTAHLIERLESEDPNLRVALAWCETRQDGVETGLLLAGALSWYWYLLGSQHEGRIWLEAILARSAAARAHLDAATFEAGWAAGQTITKEQAITEALQEAWLKRWPRSHTAIHTIGKGARS